MKAGPPQNNYPAGNVVATSLTPVIAGVKLLHADESLLVLDKPAGLLSVPGRGEDKQDCLSARVQAVFPDALIVHRLDQATSGLTLMARGAAMQRALSRSFETREVSKRYVAVVSGHLPPSDDENGWGLIDLPIIVDWPNRPLRIINTERGKPSQTRWRVHSHDAAANTTRVELEPITGRSHQLRVHLKALGHPILGDAMYAPEAVQAAAPRLLLHAAVLRFTHPASGVTMSFESKSGF
ncbi:ribosomal large subunit pseudouridine synthase A [Polaromonas sp. YR568]|uniref:pseudouridine synthase n=1 Tax=Polaromonas sp. YR568 TaxID=1855301 RepID=UPI0008E990B9|nr:pseudouridine synthase [Polaromonas sp. YR568]SFU40686.1 ribosomal large subunit pseudouridine synthase A [Polaromonas sp. YR568]